MATSPATATPTLAQAATAGNWIKVTIFVWGGEGQQVSSIAAPSVFTLAGSYTTTDGHSSIYTYYYPNCTAAASWGAFTITLANSQDLYASWLINEFSGVLSTAAPVIVTAGPVTNGTFTAGGVPADPNAVVFFDYCASSDFAAGDNNAASSAPISPAGSWADYNDTTANYNGGVLGYCYMEPNPAPNLASATVVPNQASGITGLMFAMSPVTSAPSRPAAPTVSLGSDGKSVVVTWGTLPANASASVFDQNGSPVISGQTGTSYTVTGLTAGSTYRYGVEFVNTGGASPESPLSQAITIPNAPAAPTTPPVVALAANQISIVVDASGGSGQLPAGVSSYSLLRSANGGPFAALPSASGLTAFPYTDTGGLTGNSYAYEVTYGNLSGSSAPGPASNAVLIPTPVPPSQGGAGSQGGGGSGGSGGGSSGSATVSLEAVAASVQAEMGSLQTGAAAAAGWAATSTAFQALATALQTISSTATGVMGALTSAETALQALNIAGDSTFAPLQQVLANLASYAPTFSAASQAASSYAATATTCASVANGLISYSADLVKAETPAQAVLAGLATLSAGQAP